MHLPVSEAKEVTDGDEPKIKAQCYAEMRKAAQAEFDAGCDLPTVTLKVDFMNCSDAEEYKQYAALYGHFPRRQRARGRPAHWRGSIHAHDTVHL